MTLKNSELEAEKRCTEVIFKFQSLRKRALIKLEAADDKQFLIDTVQEQLNDALAQTEDELLEIEMLLQDALHDSTLQFFDKITGFNKKIGDKTVNFIGEVQMHCSQF